MSGDDEQAQRADGELTSDEPAIVDEEVWEDVVSASEAEEKSTDNEGQEDEELELALHAPAGEWPAHGQRGASLHLAPRRASLSSSHESSQACHLSWIEGASWPGERGAWPHVTYHDARAVCAAQGLAKATPVESPQGEQ